MQRKIRFPILGISHETNTFSTVPATYEKFEEAHILRGQEMIDEYADSEYTIAGYLEMAEELGRYLRGEPIRARPITAVERLCRWSLRNRRIAAMGFLLACSRAPTVIQPKAKGSAP